LLEGTNYTTNPDTNEFYNIQNRYFEVDYLAQQRVFIENSDISQSVTDGN